MNITDHTDMLRKSYKRSAEFGITKSQILPKVVYVGEEFDNILKKNSELIKVS